MQRVLRTGPVVVGYYHRYCFSLPYDLKDKTIRGNIRRISSLPAPETYETLEEGKRKKIDTYLDLLLDWNTRMNLTAIKDRDEALSRHIDDGLALVPALDACIRRQEEAGAVSQSLKIKLIDIGSGAGLPGLVLAVVRPQWRICLLDSLNKRCTFNNAAAEAMQLDNIDVVWARAETAGRDENLREQFDLVTARAVAELRILAELCLPFAKVGGHWVAAKGHNPDEELRTAEKAISMLGGSSPAIENVESIAPEGKRTVVIVEKRSKMRAKYPRKPGDPKRQPL